MAALRNTFVILIFARGFHKSSGKSIKLYMLLCKRSSSITYRVLREWIVLQLLWPTLLTGSSIKCFYANSHIVTHQFLKKATQSKIWVKSKMRKVIPLYFSRKFSKDLQNITSEYIAYRSLYILVQIKIMLNGIRRCTNALAIYEKKQMSFQVCYLSFTMGSLTSLSI